MKYFVYLIVSETHVRKLSYVGYTNNLTNRIKHHNSSKGAKFTKGNNWKLIYYRTYNSKIKAMKEEYKLKKNYKLRKQIKNKNGF